MDLSADYYQVVTQMLRSAHDDNCEVLGLVSDAVADSLANDGVLHLFGSGHSSIVAREAVNRAGGLVPVSLITDPTNGWAETTPGFGIQLMAWYRRQYPMQAGEVAVVISNSGINPSPIEVALECKAQGLKVVAVTSVGMSKAATSRHPTGQRLFEVADWVLDNGVIAGDASVGVPGLDLKVGPVSTFSGAMIINLLMLKTIEKLVDRGADVPLLQSANVPGGKERNRKLIERYRGRLCWPV